MSKQNYTHIKALLPAIQTMMAARMTQREISGFQDKFVVKYALQRQKERKRHSEV